MTIVLGLFALVGVGCLWGCDHQVDSTYLGQTLMTLQGSVVNDITASLPPLDVAIVWTSGGVNEAAPTDGGAGDVPDYTYVSTRVPIADSFPANFEADVTTPPPPFSFAPAFPGAAEPSFADGFLGAVARGQQFTSLTDYGDEYVDINAGEYEAHEIVYALHDFPADSLTVQYYGALTAGYHLLYRHQLAAPPNNAAAQSTISSCLSTKEYTQAECDTFASIAYEEQPFDTPLTIHLHEP